MGNEFNPAGAELAELKRLTVATATTLNALAQKDAALATTPRAYAQAQLEIASANNLMSLQRTTNETPFKLKPLGQYTADEIAAARADGVNLERQLLADQKALKEPLINQMIRNDPKALRAVMAGDDAIALGRAGAMAETVVHPAALEAEMKARIFASQSAEVRVLLSRMSGEGAAAVRLISKAAGPAAAVAIELYNAAMDYQDGLHDKDVNDAAIAMALAEYEKNHRDNRGNVSVDVEQGHAAQELSH